MLKDVLLGFWSAAFGTVVAGPINIPDLFEKGLIAGFFGFTLWWVLLTLSKKMEFLTTKIDDLTGAIYKLRDEIREERR